MFMRTSKILQLPYQVNNTNLEYFNKHQTKYSIHLLREEKTLSIVPKNEEYTSAIITASFAYVTIINSQLTTLIIIMLHHREHLELKPELLFRF